MRLKDKVAIVTGAGGGLGSVTSVRLAEEGAKIVVNDINEPSARKVSEQIISAGREAKVIIADISKWEEAKSLIEECVSHFGRIDILVNNAGFPRDNTIGKMTEEEWDLVVDVCLKGSFLCSKFAIRYMMEQRYGKIVNISSRALSGTPGQANYSSAKAGIVGLTKALAKEVGRYNINVNCIAPGLILHEGAYRLPNWQKFVDRFIEQSPFKRAGAPMEIANTVLFLVSEDSSYITGDVIHVSGGRF